MAQPTRAATTTRSAAPARASAATRGGVTTRQPSPARPRSRHVPDPDPYRRAYSRDKGQLVRRLSRMEGQVRGIARMIEREEYCVDILQQTAALRAAVDALSVLVLEDHVQGCVRTAAEGGKVDEYVEEVIDVVRRTLGRPLRGTRSA
jgi:CsoR family transcriptional regulator, copper-sensing transcriptional repressor